MRILLKSAVLAAGIMAAAGSLAAAQDQNPADVARFYAGLPVPADSAIGKFAEAKAWHGLRRFRLRGLANVNMEGLFVAAGQNLKRYLAVSGWGRRHAPCGSLVARSEEPRPLAAISE